MKETMKCCLISMGIGVVVGAMIASNNKKVSSAMKEAKTVAMEKLEEAKEGIEKMKEKIEDKIEEKAEQETTSQKNNQSKTKASK